MTEQKAIEIIKREEQWESNSSISKAFNMAIEALEEVEQYRAIGTQEECRTAVEKLRKVEEVVKEWDKVGYAYSNNHMCEIKMIVKGGGVDG